MNWWEFPEEGMEPVKAPLARTRQDRITDIEEELHEEAATIVADAMHFMDVLPGPLNEDGEPTEPVVPAAWVAELGEERAKKRLRTAQLALSSSKDAPVGLKMAKDALVGMAKVRAAKNAPARTLNMIVVNMAGPLPEFEEMEVLK